MRLFLILLILLACIGSSSSPAMFWIIVNEHILRVGQQVCLNVWRCPNSDLKTAHIARVACIFEAILIALQKAFHVIPKEVSFLISMGSFLVTDQEWLDLKGFRFYFHSFSCHSTASTWSHGSVERVAFRGFYLDLRRRLPGVWHCRRDEHRGPVRFERLLIWFRKTNSSLKLITIWV